MYIHSCVASGSEGSIGFYCITCMHGHFLSLVYFIVVCTHQTCWGSVGLCLSLCNFRAYGGPIWISFVHNCVSYVDFMVSSINGVKLSLSWNS